jgi:transcriptional regulator with XRE-family HTH domain
MDFGKYAQTILESTRESTVGIELDLRFDIIDFIKMRLKETGLTQKSLALKMKMKDSQLTRILNAESNITLETVARIYHAFDCRPTITKRHAISESVSEDRVSIKQAQICEPHIKYMTAGLN